MRNGKWKSEAALDIEERLQAKCKCSHRKRAKVFHLHRNGKEAEVGIRKRVEVAKVLDDRNLCSEQQRMDGTSACTGIVDVKRIDAHESGARVYEELGRLGGEEGMSAIRIFLSAPMTIPSSVK